jgi:hypothetical protein
MELARSLGFAYPSSICNIEKGRRRVGADELTDLARALGCGVADLVKTED